MPSVQRAVTVLKRLYRAYKMTFLLRAGICVGLSIALIYLICTGLYKDIHGKHVAVVERKEPFVSTNKSGPAVQLVTPKCFSANHENTGNPIYMITPTYKRAEQIPELIRTGQTLLHVKNLVWIVVEDTAVENDVVKEYLSGSGLQYIYLIAQMPEKFQKVENKPRGVANRNKGLQWVRGNAKHGVVYFGDDDNTYDLRIFQEMRSTKVVSMFPVGLVTEVGVSSPIVKDGVVVDFYDGWVANRKFAVDMAGFAISVETILKYPDAIMPFKVGYEEEGILIALHIEKQQIEPKAQNCTKIWVWHTQTKKNKPVSEKKTMKKIKASGQDSNLKELRKLVWRGN